VPLTNPRPRGLRRSLNWVKDHLEDDYTPGGLRTPEPMAPTSVTASSSNNFGVTTLILTLSTDEPWFTVYNGDTTGHQFVGTYRVTSAGGSATKTVLVPTQGTYSFSTAAFATVSLDTFTGSVIGDYTPTAAPTVTVATAGNRNVLETEAGGAVYASSSAEVITAGTTVIPVGALVTYSLCIGGQLATAGSVLDVYLNGHSTGLHLAINLSGSLSGSFLMPVADKIDAIYSNQDSVNHFISYTWQATTP
jgi:hypothetical protein